MTKPVVLLILDGWGVAPPSEGNAITLARPAAYQRLLRRYPHTLLKASGSAVGLPSKQYGNSEAGHMNIGAGRIVEQDAVRINHQIEDGRFQKNVAFLEAIKHAKHQHGHLHLMGLLTGKESGHAYPLHLTALLDLAAAHRVPVFLHLFTDGRDTSKFDAIGLLRTLEKHLQTNQRIATIIGRVWAMDRAKRWVRTGRAYNAMVLGQGKVATSAEQAVQAGYQRGENDEFLLPTVIGATAAERLAGRIRGHDAIIFFHLRSDRARQMAKAFVQGSFERMNPGSFRRKKVLRHILFVAMTEFGPDLPNILTAFPSVTLQDTLPIALDGRHQLYIAESEKYAHITYFFNGGYAAPVAKEDRVMIPSSNVLSFDKQPDMQTVAITSRIVQALKKQQYDFIAANFANADMVAHTGNLKASVRAVQVIDRAIHRLVSVVLPLGGTLLITSDHGNIEEVLNGKTGGVDTEHSGNPIPLLIVGQGGKNIRLRKTGILADIAPTILQIVGCPQPKSMTGTSLIL